MDIDCCQSKRQLNSIRTTRFDFQNSSSFCTSIACICLLNLCSSIYWRLCNGNYIAATKSKGEFPFIDFRLPAEQSIWSLAHIVNENSCNFAGCEVSLNVLCRCVVRLCQFSSVRCCDTCKGKRKEIYGLYSSYSLGVTTHSGFCIHSPLAGFSLLFRGF